MHKCCHGLDELCCRVIRAWRAWIWAVPFFDEQQLDVAGPSGLETSADISTVGQVGHMFKRFTNFTIYSDLLTIPTIPQWPEVNCVGGSFAPCRVDMALRRGIWASELKIFERHGQLLRQFFTTWIAGVLNGFVHGLLVPYHSKNLVIYVDLLTYNWYMANLRHPAQKNLSWWT